MIGRESAPHAVGRAPSARQDLGARLASPSGSHYLGADQLGRDTWSRLVYGGRISLGAGLGATLVGVAIGVILGLVSGYAGGKVDAFIMRVADVQLSFPAILIALLIDGLARVALPKNLHDQLAVYVLIFAIAAAGWVNYARTVRGSTLVERNKEYVQAARVIGRHRIERAKRVGGRKHAAIARIAGRRGEVLGPVARANPHSPFGGSQP